MSKRHKAFRFRLKPTCDQAKTFSRFAGARRWVWNWALSRWKEYYAEHGKSIPLSLLSSELTALKQQPETTWLTEINAQLLQQVLADLHRAFTNFFEKRARYPRFKNKKTDRSRFRFPQSVKVKDDQVYLPKIGWINMRLSQPVDLPIKSATVRRDVMGFWHVTLTATFDMPDVTAPLARQERTVGIDLGLIDFATFSDGKLETVPCPKFLRKTATQAATSEQGVGSDKQGLETPSQGEAQDSQGTGQDR